MRPDPLLRWLVRLLASSDLRQTRFSYRVHGMEALDKKTPCLILMNHSSFLDLEIAARIFKKRPYGIVCTADGFVGKSMLMRRLGCIPTQKFVPDLSLIGDIRYMLEKNKCSVLMYPEASYSFDGTATPLPRKMGILLKRLNVPVVTVIAQGSFARDPLYNCLQKRQVTVTAEVSLLFTPEQIRTLSVAQLDDRLDEVFSFDYFRWQQENGIVIDEPFRADGLNRILYKCPHCGAEGQTEGRGTELVCHACGKRYELTPTGFLRSPDGDTAFAHIPDWYAWERSQVREQIASGTYRLDADVDIGVMVDHKAIYLVGQGHLTHDENGFRLTGCDGKLCYTQSPLAGYGLYADYYWYELGDMICIGNRDILYYCFPKNCGDVVARTRLAAEELYKLKKRKC